MKALSLGSLLLFGLAGAQTDAASPVPSCVVDCTDSLAKQLSPAERMQTLCHGVAGQRALFQCLVNSCHAHTYGSALGHVVSACSDLGVAISPLHPVEVLYATHAKRQVVPTQPGPVLPGPSTLYHTRTLTLNHHVSMGLECRTGADGIITLSVDVPDPGATPPPASKNVTTACTSSDAPASLVVSNTLAPAQSTACPCHGTDSSSIPSLQLMSATLLQGPTEQQTTTVPSPSSSLVITQFCYQRSSSVAHRIIYS
ncbi:hypothetical protein G6O67_002089 [Ophiocordyceps sinensis]|uniref:Extracellular membrane protein CFEM domain-containing protein n=1 Tax=Ophiocordyceps sinensis TaxID=72228 RepID=A0A8H4PTJ0_9HYPO|nr:hypothetical protein G6O67_002089 [Ophiocordyceps sinensis]